MDFYGNQDCLGILRVLFMYKGYKQLVILVGIIDFNENFH